MAKYGILTKVSKFVGKEGKVAYIFRQMFEFSEYNLCDQVVIR